MTKWRGAAGTAELRGAEERVWRVAGGRRMLARLGRWRVAGAELDLGPSGRRHGALPSSEGKQAGRQTDKKFPNQTGVVFPPEG